MCVTKGSIVLTLHRPATVAWRTPQRREAPLAKWPPASEDCGRIPPWSGGCYTCPQQHFVMSKHTTVHLLYWCNASGIFTRSGRSSPVTLARPLRMVAKLCEIIASAPVAGVDVPRRSRLVHPRPGLRHPRPSSLSRLARVLVQASKPRYTCVYLYSSPAGSSSSGGGGGGSAQW